MAYDALPEVLLRWDGQFVYVNGTEVSDAELLKAAGLARETLGELAHELEHTPRRRRNAPEDEE